MGDRPSVAELARALPAGPGADEVHVWAVPLARPPARPEFLRPILSTDERERADRFRFEDDRRRFVVGRGVLRVLLGRCLGRDPARLSFEYGPYGKPALPGRAAVEFSVSHSGGWVLLGLANGRPVGVDVERIRPVPDLERIVARYFTPGEAAGILAEEGERRLRAFFACWTRKEACSKADGGGLAGSMRRFEVPVRAAPGTAAIEPSDRSGGEARWQLWSLELGPGYLAAAAAAGEALTLVTRQWTAEPGVTEWPG